MQRDAHRRMQHNPSPVVLQMNRSSFRKAHLRIGFFALSLTLLVAAAAVGQTVASSGPTYSYADLDTYWQNQVQGQALSTLTTSNIGAALGNPKPLSSSTGGTGKTGGKPAWPPTGTPAGTDAGIAPTIYFDTVLPSGPAFDGEMLAREVVLSGFVAKADNYFPAAIVATGNPSTDHTAQLAVQAQNQTVTQRGFSARIELFLLGVLQYYEAATIVDKCSNVKVLQRLLAQLDAIGLPGAPLTDTRFAALQITLNGFLTAIPAGSQTNFRGQIAAATACLVSEVSSKADDLANAGIALDSLVVADLTQPGDPNSDGGITVTDELNAMNAQAGTWDDLLNQLTSLDPRSNDLLQLQLDLTNMQSNFNMVQQDMMGAQGAVAAMQAKLVDAGMMTSAGQPTDAGLITNIQAVLANPDAGPGTLPPLNTLSAEQSALQSALLGYLTSLQGAAAALPGTGLDVCATIDLNYANAGGNATAIQSCLAALDTAVKNAGATTPQQQEMAAFGQAAEILSTLILEQRQGVALTSCTTTYPANCP